MIIEPHHDGSLRHMSTDRPRLGDRVEVRLRIPRGIGVDRVHLRTVHDGEPAYHRLSLRSADQRDAWWAGELEIHNPVANYRFLVDGEVGYGWVNATGWHRGCEVLDTADFLLSASPGPPDWVADAVVLQVFPDRFARSAAANSRPVPAWASVSDWDDPVAKRDGRYGNQFYGGDLDGIREHLDHVARLGANVLYLTPVFPAGSTHRYDATSFDHVDPLLGGDQALARLVRAAHDREIRVMGDLTTNHTGAGHAWFRAAQRDAACPEAGFYFFEDHPHRYVGWLGHRSLPKLDWRSERLREAFLRGPDSVVGRWLQPPYSLDGWRIDVANMTGRLRDLDLAHDVAGEIRATMREVCPDGWLVGEHWYSAGPDLMGAGWHGTMNYAGFTRPVWAWLADHPRGALTGDSFLGTPTGYGVPRLSGQEAARAIREVSATMPWRSLAAGMNSLDSHDTARFITVVGGDLGRYTAGLTLLFTLPGAPTVFAGAETGLGGADGELSRIPIPWRRPDLWDEQVVLLHEQLPVVRHRSAALRRGSLRWLAAHDHALTFEREAPDGSERVLVHVSRAGHPPVALPSCWFEQAESLIGDSLPTRGPEGWQLPSHGPAAHVWRVR